MSRTGIAWSLALVLLSGLLPPTVMAGTTSAVSPASLGVSTVTYIWLENPDQQHILPVTPGTPVRIRAQVSGVPLGGLGSMTFEESVNGSWNLLGASPTQSDGSGGGQSALDLASLSEGTHTLRATYAGDAATAGSNRVQDVTVSRIVTALIYGTTGDLQASHPLSIWVQPQDVGPLPYTGTLSLTDGGNLVGSTTGNWQLAVYLDSVPAGTHHYVAAYSGDDNYTADTVSFDVVIAADVVEATVSPLTYSTFYPYKDGYRDTTTARGTRVEAASATFTVRTSGGTIVRKGSIASATGAYSWIWNGLNTAGARVAAGTYSITTSLYDGHVHKTVKQSVVVSNKRLYWYTGDLYKTASQAQRSTSSWAAWLFSMPSAAAYRSLRLYVYGSALITFNPSGFGAQDRRDCSWSSISPNCVRTSFRFAPYLTWVSGGLSAYNVSSHYVRAYVWAGYDGGSVKVSKLRLHYQYGLLK